MEVDMMNKVDSKNLKSCWWDSHLNPENSEWLAENSKEMDLNVKQIMKLVEDNSEDVTKSEVIVQVQELYRIYRNLAERYDRLTGELRKTQGPDSGLDQISPMVTPDKPVQQASSFSSVGGSSEKEGTESSSFSSDSDSDSESFISSVNVYLSSAMDTDKSKMRENRRYEELNEKLTKYEEELRDSNLKLLLAEEEIVKLNTKLKKSESLELELQKQIIELEACFSNSNSEVMRLMEELSTSKENIIASEEEIVMLNAQILRYENNLLNRSHEVEELKGALCDARDNFSIQKASFQSEIFGLLEKETLLEARLEEWELHGNLLEEKIRQCETKKSEIESLLVVQETNLQGQINQLRTELNEKGIRIEALNKNLDKMKLKYDMLMTDKDCVTATVNNLVAEVRSRDLQIRQMEDHLQQLSKEHMQLTKNLEDELKMKIKDLEKEVDKQRNMILDVSEEKREVIRQLTFSLDHYRSGYKDFQTFLKHKRHAVIAL